MYIQLIKKSKITIEQEFLIFFRYVTVDRPLTPLKGIDP